MRSSPEFDLIAAIRDRLGDAPGAGRDGVRIGIGDDAAVIAAADGSVRAVSIDAIVDGVAFRRRWCPPRAIGRKAAGAALSDLAAMGAEPAELYVWVGIPEDLDRDEALELSDGIAEVAERAGAALLGGDLTASPILAVAVTAIGTAPDAERIVGRAGATAGDAVCVSGALGGAAAGLMLLEHPELAAEVPDAAAAVVRPMAVTETASTAEPVRSPPSRAAPDSSAWSARPSQSSRASSRPKSSGTPTQT